MSDSAMRVKPAIEEPSIHCPPSIDMLEHAGGDGDALDDAHDIGELQVDEADRSPSIRARICSLVGVGPRMASRRSRVVSGTQVLLSKRRGRNSCHVAGTTILAANQSRFDGIAADVAPVAATQVHPCRELLPLPAIGTRHGVMPGSPPSATVDDDRATSDTLTHGRARNPRPRGGPRDVRTLDVEVEVELVRGDAQVDRLDLVRPACSRSRCR